ncbi:uncharacterized protein LOC110432711 [Sorghum bicolor]|uniref:uncharacterized protein LOC110432711 n=1 Tax=Sorghum bicolor TaxID=4558 RepID=UPI000B4250E9|nr:uncharacterized protein LOC110432711 [Sorghum bicolor]|eukprot:XP_021309174.1 uncharacterized protein LOC110432711 [Sorghum bicolor]
MASGSSSAAPAATSLDGAYSLMTFINTIPPLKGDNYVEWRKKIDMAFTFAEVDWVLDTERPVQPVPPVRATDETDDAWQKREREFAPIQMSYDLEKKKWESANKKCKTLK